MLKKVIAALVAASFAALGTATVAQATSTDPGSSPDNPIILTDQKDAPEGAVTDGPLTSEQTCSTSQTWVLTVPGERHDAVTHEEYQYEHVVPAVDEKSHQEWSTEERTRDLIPGEHHDAVTHVENKYRQTPPYWTVEHKEIKGWQYTNGKFVQANASTWYQIPDSVVSAAGVNPFTVAQTGTVSLGYYSNQDWNGNGPGKGTAPNVQYRITSVDVYGSDPHAAFQIKQTNGPTLYWSGSAWVTGLSNAAWVTVAPPTGELFDTRTVTDKAAYDDPDTYSAWSSWTVLATGLLSAPVLPADTVLHEYRLTSDSPKTVVDVVFVPGYTEYYVDGAGAPTLTLTDDPDTNSNWTTDTPGSPWVQINQRTVTDKEAYDDPDVVTYYAWSDGKTCPTPTPTPTPTVTPTPTPTPTVTPSPTPSPTETTVIGTVDHELAQTGMDVRAWLIVIAVVFILGVGALGLAARKNGTKE